MTVEMLHTTFTRGRMENQWLKAAKRLNALSETGKQFTQDKFDQERYHEISEISVELLASLSEVPISVIKGLVKVGVKGYETPKVDVRGAVFYHNKILLVREKGDGLWSLPGGYADVGLTPSENIEKEIREEACLVVKAKSLYSVRHKARGSYDPDTLDYYKLFFLCEAINGSEVSPGMEISEVGYFDAENIPPLSTNRVVLTDLLEAWECLSREVVQTRFD